MAKKKPKQKFYNHPTFLAIVGIIVTVCATWYARASYIETKRSNDISIGNNKTILEAVIVHEGENILVASGEVAVNILVENNWQEPLLSDEKELQGYDAYSSLMVSYLNYEGTFIKDDSFPFSEKVGKGEKKKNIIRINPPIETKTIQVRLSCKPKNIDIKPCVSRSNVISFAYLRKIEILGVDATKNNDKINLWIARIEIAQAFWVEQSEYVYKTVPAGIEFPVVHKDARENWGWIVLLYNSNFYSPDSVVVRKMVELLHRTYGYAPIILKEYTLENFNFYTQRFFECKPEWWTNICVSKTMKFVDMKSGADPEWNLFSKTIFSENPYLDFMFILPYNNQK